ncbi:CGNR zinc finger domain-containing protein [Kribbella sp. NPDC056951]|uniref:CGNR zinc finger domain-containing protein n=1 Tax=Kribbella sp. NPDC056951 TaxID=3345978 RepID=UPI00362DDBC6
MLYQPELIGGHVALDLLNTVSWRLDPPRTVDRIATAEALATWRAAAGLSGDSDPRRVATVRAVVYDAVLPIARGTGPAELRELQTLLAGAVRRATPAGPRPMDWGGANLVDELVLAAGRLLEREDLSRLRECQDDGCGWLFLDRSKNGSRRWCSSGDCGNRARAKRHYERVRAGRES